MNLYTEKAFTYVIAYKQIENIYLLMLRYMINNHLINFVIHIAFYNTLI